MSNADAMLKTLLAADDAPARDPGFTLAVLERVERRRFWSEAAMLAPLALAACVALWALAPILTELAVSWIGPFGQGVALPVLAVVLTLAAMALTGRGPARV